MRSEMSLMNKKKTSNCRHLVRNTMFWMTKIPHQYLFYTSSLNFSHFPKFSTLISMKSLIQNHTKNNFQLVFSLQLFITNHLSSGTKVLLISLCCDFSSEDSWQENGVQTNHYSSPVVQEEPFSTYFEEKVPIPEAPNQVWPKTQMLPVT